MPDSLPVLFGRVVRRRREVAEMSQEGLADAVKPELTRQYIGMIERGETNPTLSVIQCLAVALGTTETALVQEAEEGQAPKGKPPSGERRSRRSG